MEATCAELCTLESEITNALACLDEWAAYVECNWKIVLSQFGLDCDLSCDDAAQTDNDLRTPDDDFFHDYVNVFEASDDDATPTDDDDDFFAPLFNDDNEESDRASTPKQAIAAIIAVAVAAAAAPRRRHRRPAPRPPRARVD